LLKVTGYVYFISPMRTAETKTNKRVFLLWHLLSATGLIFLLCGCPYQSRFKIDAAPQVATDPQLLGNWNGEITEESGRQRDVKVHFAPKNDYEYDVYFCGYFGRYNDPNPKRQDTIWGSAFLSNVDDNRFLNVNLDGKYYIVHVIYENDHLSLLPMNEHFTSFYIRSDEEMRKRLAYHFKTRRFPLYDEGFSLQNMTRGN